MIGLNKEQIKKTFPNIKRGLEKYLWLQAEVKKRDVSKDKEFQRKFNYFYRVTPFRKLGWQKEFYKLLERNKKGNASFKSILTKLYGKTGRMEASFASKLLATINPKMPVIDRVVFQNLNLHLPAKGVKNRHMIINDKYQNLIREFTQFLKTENGKYLVKQFVREYPKAKITKVKMLDFVLWQIRN